MDGSNLESLHPKRDGSGDASKWRTVSDVHGIIKTKAAKHPKHAKQVVRVGDIKPRKNISGGVGDGRYRLTVLANQIKG